MDKIYKSKGYMTIVCTEDGPAFFIAEKEDILKPFNGEDIMNTFKHHIYNLIKGEEFLKQVKEGYFINYDGNIANIFIDGYISNLGLYCGDICQGAFLVDENTFLNICCNYDVEVNWANK